MASEGIQAYKQLETNFNSAINFLMATSKNINLEYKKQLSKSTLKQESIIGLLVILLSKTIEGKSQISLEEMEIIRKIVKTIDGFMRDPVQPNIQVCLEYDLYSILELLLKFSYQ